MTLGEIKAKLLEMRGEWDVHRDGAIRHKTKMFENESLCPLNVVFDNYDYNLRAIDNAILNNGVELFDACQVVIASDCKFTHIVDKVFKRMVIDLRQWMMDNMMEEIEYGYG